MDWYERRPTEYREDTWHLTLAEHGAYNLLLDHYYKNESPLPDNDRALASICGCPMDEWLVVKPAVVAFFEHKNGRYVQTKCEDILIKAYEKRKDGAQRVEKYRARNKGVMRNQHVSNVPTGQDRTRQDSKEYMHIISQFDDFWSAYPRKVGKGQAEKQFTKTLKTFSFDEIMAGLAAFCDAAQTMDKKFIPYPATWLNGKRWQDDHSDNNPAPSNNSGEGSVVTAIRNGIAWAEAQS